jgi:SAM-dependent methyltransferase
MVSATHTLHDYSLRDVVNLTRAAMLADKVDRCIDQERFQHILTAHGADDYRYRKYFTKRRWLRSKLMRALEAGIDRMPPGAILDLGCGPGYFLHVCKYFGHRVHGVDLPGDPFFDDMMGLFAIERTDAEIAPFRELPRIGQRFDLVAAHQICFNGHASGRPWGIEEWNFLLADLRDHHLTPGGTIALEFNPEPSSEYYDEKLRAWFARMGARMFRGRVIIRDATAALEKKAA